MKDINPKMVRIFREGLLRWNQTNTRELPWKEEKDPYLIWVSEIILQQTRVEQGLPYYQKFREAYPTVFDLANAPEDEVMKMWEGLGYYSRARHLHAAAKYIASELGGIFPEDHASILALKGVGPYTAAAVASFAFNLPYPVVDGNVFRVLARFFGISVPIDCTEGKKGFRKLAEQLIDKKDPATYNQAIMDFGATHCRPKNPLCSSCSLKEDCRALEKGIVKQLPIKEKKLKKKNRFFNYQVIYQEESVWIKKRVEKDIWKNLYDFPLIETNKLIEREELVATEQWKNNFKPLELILERKTDYFKQTLSHQYIFAVFWQWKMQTPVVMDQKDWLLIEKKDLKKFAFPKIIDWYLKDKSLNLKLF